MTTATPLALPARVPERVGGYASDDWPALPPLSTLVNRVHCMDCLEFMALLPDNSINCIVTSPPYFGLRDYGVTGQIGLEKTPAEYVQALVTLFREARRVLRDDGVMWLNLGDTFGRGSRGAFGVETLRGDNQPGYPTSPNLPEKNLLLIPARVAIALQDDGWICRMDVIWHKPNPMPESVTDRPTKAHEYVYMFVKSGKYWYDAEAIKEPAVNGDPNPPRGSKGVVGQQNAGNRKQDDLGKRTYTGFNERWDNRSEPLENRNKRSVWTVPTQPFSGAHFATFPPALIEPMILAGCPRGGIVYDPFMGSGTTALVARALGCNYIGSELNAEYVKIARDRLRMPFEKRQIEQKNADLITVEFPDGTNQPPLFAKLAG